jgi:hypothetical protein
MTSLEKYLEQLKALKLQHSVTAIENPGEISERNYAYACGFNSGLRKALELLDKVLQEEKFG